GSGRAPPFAARYTGPSIGWLSTGDHALAKPTIEPAGQSSAAIFSRVQVVRRFAWSRMVDEGSVTRAAPMFASPLRGTTVNRVRGWNDRSVDLRPLFMIKARNRGANPSQAQSAARKRLASDATSPATEFQRDT